MKIKTVFLVLMLAFLVTVIHPRAENGVYVDVNYSMDITASPNDRFALTYRYVGGEETATIEVNAYDINGKQGKITLGEGDYEISGIRYMGDNIDIEAKGYGCISNFHICEGGDYSYITISIGKTACDSLKDTYGNVLFRQNEEAVEEITEPVSPATSVLTGTQAEPQATEQAVMDGTAGTEGQATEAGNEAGAVMAEETAMQDTAQETYEDEQDKTDSHNQNGFSSLTKMVPIILFLGILFAGVYIYMSKSGKIMK